MADIFEWGNSMKRVLSELILGIGLCLILLASPAAFAANIMPGSVVQAVNSIRAAHGLPALAPHSGLQKAASQQSVLMARAGKMAHTVSRGNSFSSRLKRVGYRGPAAENIARGQKNLKSVLRGWMNSRGHRRNILHPKMKYFGLAAVKSGGRNYWTMALGG
ncbi:MAG: hypothetical protein COC23_00375 [Hyphomicrobiales bacterium]|nr:MAG: hypothetical protein COC23_00375 [Hyphomicrobiales bacterium]